MIRSMTGFGKAAGEYNGQHIGVEISSVNHRFLDVSVRLPTGWAELEHPIREAVKALLSRGKVNVTITRKLGIGASHRVQFDADAARQYIQSSRELSELLGSGERLGLSDLAKMDGVFYAEEEEGDFETITRVVLAALDEALDRLVEMRTGEGRRLAEELNNRLVLIQTNLSDVELRLPEVNALQEERLRARIAELNADVNVAEERIALELAVLADKADVTEEIVRLKAHIEHFRELLESPGHAGRELNFLAQEMQREINTLGVKVRDSDVARTVLQLKADLEKSREQIQNVE